MVRKVTFSVWFISLIVWNYVFPEAAPWEDVFVGVCLYFFKRVMDKNIYE